MLERVAGIEPASSAWKAEVLPLNYTRGTFTPTPGPTPSAGEPSSPAGFNLGGGGWIRTTEARASDLQSDPFGHSGTPPEGRTFSRCQGRVSTLNFTLKIPLYACVCPRFEKCVRAVVIFALISPRRLGSTGSPIESLLRCWNMIQTRARRDYARRQIRICIGKEMELARGIEPPTG